MFFEDDLLYRTLGTIVDVERDLRNKVKRSIRVPNDVFCVVVDGSRPNKTTKPQRKNAILSKVDKVLFQDRATVVFWKDGTKTVVKCSDEETFDPEKGLAMAILKKLMGNKYYEDVKEVIDLFYDPSNTKDVTNNKSTKTTTKKTTNKTTSKTTKKSE